MSANSHCTSLILKETHFQWLLFLRKKGEGLHGFLTLWFRTKNRNSKRIFCVAHLHLKVFLCIEHKDCIDYCCWARQWYFATIWTKDPLRIYPINLSLISDHRRINFLVKHRSKGRGQLLYLLDFSFWTRHFQKKKQQFFMKSPCYVCVKLFLL